MAIIKAVSSKSPIKTAIAYISKEEKTDKKLLSGYNLTSPETSYDEMQITKEFETDEFDICPDIIGTQDRVF